MPGADFAVVVRNALRARSAGLATAAGVVGGLVLHTLLAAFGLAALLTASPVAYAVLTWMGACYLFYLGSRMLAELRSRPGTPAPVIPDAPRGGGAARTGDVDLRRATDVAVHVAASLRQGFLTNATNPKAPVLFLSLLPQFIPAGAAVLPRTLELCAIIVLCGTLWFPTVALAVDRAGPLLRRPGASFAITAVTGTALLVLGLFIVVDGVL